eukprot:5184366-Pyramimonas_sp.AAC.1
MPASKLAVTPRNAVSTRRAREDHRSDHRDDSINDPACALVPDLMFLAGLPLLVVWSSFQPISPCASCRAHSSDVTNLAMSDHERGCRRHCRGRGVQEEGG